MADKLIEPGEPKLEQPFQFTIRTLIIITSVIAVFLALVVQEAPVFITVGYVFLVLIGVALQKQKKGIAFGLIILGLCGTGYKAWEAAQQWADREKQRALWVERTEPILEKYAKEIEVSLNLESRKDKSEYHTISIRLINPTSSPIMYSRYSESSPWYSIQRWENGRWVNHRVGWFCGTGLRECVIPSGRSSIIPVRVANDLFPIRVGVEYSHGAETLEQEVVWSARIEKDPSNISDAGDNNSP